MAPVLGSDQSALLEHVRFCVHRIEAITDNGGTIESAVARRLRIEYPGALHHVINRGNYRRDLFESDGTNEAFLRTLFETAGKFAWKVHGYVLMRNHFHLAVETPEPTLGEGMHWLQSTMATRVNRMRTESGHLFQGRYKALLIEDDAALARVVDYIHLNPVRAKVVEPDRLTAYSWSSLTALMTGQRLDALVAETWLQARGGWHDDEHGLIAYRDYLLELAREEAAWERKGLVGLSRGWAIGTEAWRKALANEHGQMALSTGLAREEIGDLRQANWTASLERNLIRLGKKKEDLITKPRKQDWKVAIAREIRQESGASISWLADHLQLGGAATLRGYLHRANRENY